MKEYQKECKLKDGSIVLLRPLVAEDREELINFFQSLPEELRLYLRHDVTDMSIIESWTENIDYSKVFPILALVDERIIDFEIQTCHRMMAFYEPGVLEANPEYVSSLGENALNYANRIDVSGYCVFVNARGKAEAKKHDLFR